MRRLQWIGLCGLGVVAGCVQILGDEPYDTRGSGGGGESSGGGGLGGGSGGGGGSAGGGGLGGGGGSAGGGGLGGGASSTSSSTGMGGAGGMGGSGGIGGMGGSGGMGGMGGAGGSGPVSIREWTAGVPGVGTPPVYTFPNGWLEIACPTADRTSQVSAHTLYRGYGANAARPRNVVGKWGLSVESARMNEILNSDSWSEAATGWSSTAYAMTRTGGQPDPSGGTAAAQFDSVPAASQVASSFVGGLSTGYATAWLKGVGAMGPFAYFAVGPSETVFAYATVNDGAAWNRYEVANAEGYYRLQTLGGADGSPANIMGATSILAFAAQYESLVDGSIVHYPSSYIPTLEMARTREADTLSSSFATTLLPGGYWNVEIRLAPNYATGEATAVQHDILFLNSENRLYFDSLVGKLVLVTGGSTLAGPAAGTMTWGREQELIVKVSVTPSGRTLSLSGATTGNFAALDAANAPTPVGLTNLFLLGNASGAQECADLRYIGFFQPN